MNSKRVGQIKHNSVLEARLVALLDGTPFKE